MSSGINQIRINDPLIFPEPSGFVYWRQRDKFVKQFAQDYAVMRQFIRDVKSFSIRRAWLVQFKKRTHWLIFEEPSEFARIVITFQDFNETVAGK